MGGDCSCFDIDIDNDGRWVLEEREEREERVGMKKWNWLLCRPFCCQVWVVTLRSSMEEFYTHLSWIQA